MSLVSDALRKARQYATARDIQRHGAAAGSFSPPPRRSRLGLGLLLGAAIALAAAAAGAVFVLWALNRQQAETADAEATAPVPAAAATPPAATPVAADRADSRASTGVSASATAAASSAEAPAPPEGVANAVESTAPEKPSPEPADVPTLAAPAGERVYLLRADLGYATLRLDFLVYKPGGGFGRVNGQDVAPGTIVDGFTVEEIGPDFIRLRDTRGPLVLRTR